MGQWARVLVSQLESTTQKKKLFLKVDDFCTIPYFFPAEKKFWWDPKIFSSWASDSEKAALWGYGLMSRDINEDQAKSSRVGVSNGARWKVAG